MIQALQVNYKNEPNKNTKLIKMKNKNLMSYIMSNIQHKMFHNQSSEYIHEVTLCVVHLCCFALLTSCLPALLASAETQSENQPPIDSTSKITEKLNPAPFINLNVEDTNNPLIHQLQQARISVYQPEKASKSKNELKQMIEKIRSIALQSQKQTTEPVIAAKPTPAIEPNGALPYTKTNVKPEKTPAPPEPERLIESDRQYKPLNENTLQMLENLTQNPDQVKNPFELAEVLFLSGYAEKASVFYQEALNRNDPNDIDSVQENAWIMYQIGNCLRNDDLQAAKNAYRKLIAEYPDNALTNLAKVQEKVIDWYLQEKPHTLIKECEQLEDEIKLITKN